MHYAGTNVMEMESDKGKMHVKSEGIFIKTYSKLLTKLLPLHNFTDVYRQLNKSSVIFGVSAIRLFKSPPVSTCVPYQICNCCFNRCRIQSICIAIEQIQYY